MRNSKVMFHRQWFLKFGGTLNLDIKNSKEI